MGKAGLGIVVRNGFLEEVTFKLRDEKESAQKDPREKQPRQRQQHV